MYMYIGYAELACMGTYVNIISYIVAAGLIETHMYSVSHDTVTAICTKACSKIIRTSGCVTTTWRLSNHELCIVLR